MADWSNLPEDILLLIAFRLFSVVELLRFRSVCTSWRTSVSVADINPFPSHPLIQLNPTVADINPFPLIQLNLFPSRAYFFRVSNSSSSKGWLIKYEVEGLRYGKLRLLNPLSRLMLRTICKSIDLLDYTFTEIQSAYVVKDLRAYFLFTKIVLGGNHRLIGIDYDGEIRYWNGNIWTRINGQYAHFCDMIVHNGLTYAVDRDGIVWWVTSSYGILRYGPSFYENITEYPYRDRSLVECCGVFYIVDRIWEDSSEGNLLPTTVGFEVFKMDEELWQWVQVNSLREYAFVIATDTCFSVLADEFYGCLPNSIYFSEQDQCEVNVFKLDDGSIETMPLWFFQMFMPGFI